MRTRSRCTREPNLCVASGQLRIYEAGVSRGTFGSFAVGDRLRVSVEGGVVRYYRNATPLYTSTVRGYLNLPIFV